jgi:hypothetical protein
MKAPANASPSPTLESLSSYQASIHAATGAPSRLLSIIEKIMREEVFHSTLDWQTHAQLDRGAKRAYTLYRADSAFYDASATLNACEYSVMRAEQELEAARATGDDSVISAAAAHLAEAKFQRTRARKNYERICGHAVA